MNTDNFVSVYDVLMAEHTLIAELRDSNEAGEKVAYVQGVNDMAEVIRDQIEKRSATIMYADVIKASAMPYGGDQC